LLAIHVFTPHAWPFERPGAGTYWDLSRKIPSSHHATVPIPRNLGDLRALLTNQTKATGYLVMMAVGLGSFTVALCCARLARERRLAAAAVAVGATLCFYTIYAFVLLALETHRLPFPLFQDYLVGWMELESRSGRDGSRIAYAGTNLPYYLMGSGLKNDVRYININRHANWLLHDYFRDARARGMPPWNDPRPLWDRLEQDYEAWLENLRAERIGILVVARAKPEDGKLNINDIQMFTIERQWAETHPESFTPLYGARERDPEFRFYRVHPHGKKSAHSATDPRVGAH
jgi:hypothetical protein